MNYFKFIPGMFVDIFPMTQRRYCGQPKPEYVSPIKHGKLLPTEFKYKERPEPLVVNGRHRFGVRNVVFPMCKRCRKCIWDHPGGRCLLTPFPFESSGEGIWIFHKRVDYAQRLRGPLPRDKAQWTRIRVPFIEQHLANEELGEVAYWVHYLMEIGWTP